MNGYYSKHKYLIHIWLALIIIAGVSGYFTYFKESDQSDSQNIQNNLSNQTKEKKLIADEEKTIPTQKKINIPVKLDDRSAATTKDIIQATTTIPKDSEPEVIPLAPTTTANTISFSLTINDKTTESRTAPGTTVYRTMQDLMAEGKIAFHATEYSGMGYFVDEIDGIKNDPKNGIYWIYYLNGQSAKVGVSLYSLKANDIITWKYEKAKF